MILHKHHIIPRHMGGTDDPSNLVEVTVEEHAELHRQLWEELGQWQDYCAWQGLSGQIGKEEINLMKNRMARLGKPSWNTGLKGYKAGKEHYRWGKTVSDDTRKKISKTLEGNECRAKEYIVRNVVTQEEIVVKNLRKFCDDNGLNYKSAHKAMKNGNVYLRTFQIV